MSQLGIQASFNSGEWAPSLRARVDLQKYRSGAAILENFFVDYRGGASTRAGTRYVIQAYKSATAVRLIPFQASFTVNYVLEFGDKYIRFINNGTPILETAIAATGATNANPCSISIVAPWNVGDWVYAASFVGITQLNGNYYQILSNSGTAVTLGDLNGNQIDSTLYGAYVSGGTLSRIYTLQSPYAAADLKLIKFAQNVSSLILCHPNYNPYVLTLVTSANWTLNQIQFGATVTSPTGLSIGSNLGTLGSGVWTYSYVVTSVDATGQESPPSAVITLAQRPYLGTATSGEINISWSAVAGAQSYNIYKALPLSNPTPLTGQAYGYIGNTTGTTFYENYPGIAANFNITPPIAQNPFFGAGVASVTLTNQGTNYLVVPTVAFSASPAGSTAIGAAVMQAYAVSVGSSSNGWNVGDQAIGPNGIVLIVASVSAPGGTVSSFQPLSYPGSNPGSMTTTAQLVTPILVSNANGSGAVASVNTQYQIANILITSPGSGYSAAPTVTFGTAPGAGTAVLQATTALNPAVPGFYAQRLFLGGPTANPQQFYMSQTGSYYNFNVNNPIQANNGLSGTLISGQLNTIKSVVPMPSGLIVLCDRQAWLINDGSAKSGVDPINIVANSQAYNGSANLPPIVANFDILYVQAKGSIVRDLTYNFYTNIFTGTDITVLSSHLFYGYTLQEWAFCEEPFKVVWAVRNDGVLLSLTFLKEQEFLAWTHHKTNGLFKSVCTVTEQVAVGSVDALYTVVQRVVNGNTVQYIERMAERYFPNGVADAWCVDAGIQYIGAPATNFSGATHLAGLTVTGVADGAIIPPFKMPTNGSFTLPTAAAKVTVGIGYTCTLQTLPIDMGEPTVQGKIKKIPNATVRVADTLGLSIGSTPTTTVPMKDLIIGNVSSMLTGQASQIVTGLVDGDARTFIDSSYTVPGQYYIIQSNPYPASILGVFPNYVPGDEK